MVENDEGWNSVFTAGRVGEWEFISVADNEEDFAPACEGVDKDD